MDLLHRLAGTWPLFAQRALAAICVFALSAALTPLLRALSVPTGILAYPKDRSVHSRPMPLLGGMAIYLAFSIGFVILEPLAGSRDDSLSRVPIDAGHLLEQFRGLLVGGSVAALIGLVDDRLNPRNGLRPGIHLLGQVLAAASAFAAGLRPVEGISNPLSSFPHLYADPSKHLQILLWDHADHHLWAALGAVAFSVFWIVGMMNTVNFLDGLDGLAAGVVAIAAVLLAIYSGNVHSTAGGPLPASEVLVLPPLILAAALLGFLIYNWSPATVFMGDSGAQFSGFAIGALAILGPAKIGTALLIMAIPILDVALMFVQRPASGKRFYSAGRDHLHHRLLDLGLSQRQIVALFYGVCILLGGIDLALSRVGKLVALVVVAAATVVVLIRLAGRPHPGAGGHAPAPDPDERE